MTDSERESRITQAYELMCNAETESLQRTYFADMCYHVRLRSPEQILKMEAERLLGAAYAESVVRLLDMGDGGVNKWDLSFIPLSVRVTCHPDYPAWEAFLNMENSVTLDANTTLECWNNFLIGWRREHSNDRR